MYLEVASLVELVTSLPRPQSLVRTMTKDKDYHGKGKEKEQQQHHQRQKQKQDYNGHERKRAVESALEYQKLKKVNHKVSGSFASAITTNDLYKSGGVLAGVASAGNSRPSSPGPTTSAATTSPILLKKRTSFPTSVPLANLFLNIPSHRRRPSLQTKTSGGQVSISSQRSRSESTHSPTASTSNVPSSSNLVNLKNSRIAGISTNSLSSTISSSTASFAHFTSDKPGMGDSPTVPSFETSPLSAKSDDGKFSRRFAHEYTTMRPYEEWDTSAAGEEEEEYVDGKAGGIRRIAASRRIISPQSSGQDEIPLPALSEHIGSMEERDESSLSLGIIDAAGKSKSRSSSNASSRNQYTDLDTLSEYKSRTAESGPSSRPGSVPPRSDSIQKHFSERSSKQTDSSNPPSNSSSLRASSLNQIAALKQKRATGSSEGPAKSSSSNSSSEALSTTLASSSSAAKKSSQTKMSLTSASKPPNQPNKKHHPPSLEPPLPDPLAPRVDPAPASGMYWYRALSHGLETTPLRAHTCTLVGSSVYVFGGCDSRSCFNDLYVFDADSMYWSKPIVQGDIPPPLRAMTTTAVGKKLLIFGGGDGPTYYNDLFILDTVTHRYTKPKIGGTLPSKRRAHTACLFKNGLYIFGGGDGVRALNDVWRLDVADLNKMTWKLISPPTTGGSGQTGGTVTSSSSGNLRESGKNAATASATSLLAVSTNSSSKHPVSSTNPSSSSTRPTTASSNASGSANLTSKSRPTARGYHTANMVQNKLIIFGGSDGVECFRDVWVFDVDTNVWKCVDIPVSYPRLSHTATIIGSYLFVVGGHDGVEYSSEVLLLNLVTMQWDRRKVYGLPPSGRGYHGAVLHDSRLFIIGGFDGFQ